MKNVYVFKLVLIIIFLYINSSLFLFFLNWISTPYSFLISFVFLGYSVSQFLSINLVHYPVFNRNHLYWIGFISLVLTVVSGISGLGGLPQFDINHHLHKIVDIGKLTWPIYYFDPRSFASYYFGFYTVPGLVYTFFGNVKLVAFCWELLGVYIGLFWIYLFFNKSILKTALVFGHSGLLSIIMPLFKNESLFTSKYFSFSDIPWFLLPNYFTLRWVPNQFIYGVIAIGLFLYFRKTKNLIYISTIVIAGFFWAPFVSLFFGLIYFVSLIHCLYRGYIAWDKNLVYHLVINSFLLSIIFLYLISNQTSQSIIFLIDSKQRIINYCLVLFLEVLVFYSLIQKKYKLRIELLVALVSLITLPLFKLGNGNDLFARGSFPMIFIVFLYFIKSIKFNTTLVNIKRIVLLLLISILPAKYLIHSVLNFSFKLDFKESRDVYIAIKRDYQSKKVADQYLMNSNSFFYKYLLKKDSINCSDN